MTDAKRIGRICVWPSYEIALEEDTEVSNVLRRMTVWPSERLARQNTMSGPGPHRYWRLFGVTNNGDPDFMGLGELEMYETAFSGPNVLGSGTITASSEFPGGSFSPANVVDGNYFNAQWATNALPTNGWLKYDFGSGVTKEIKSICVFASPTGEFTRSMHQIHVDYSDDGSTWTQFWADTLPSFTFNAQMGRSNEPTNEPTYTGSPYGVHAYWRLYFQETNTSAISAAEVEFRATPGGSDQAIGGAVTVSNGFSETNIFDNNNSTFWAVGGGPRDWIKYHFASPVSVAEVVYRIRGDNNPDQSPKNMLIQWSDDGTNFTTAWQIGQQTGWTNGQSRTFTSPDYV